ncbi:EamA family transporter, partial [Thioclava sp. BHET1]
MRLFFLIAVTMVAFAANSVLNRLAVSGGGIGPLEFAAVRLCSGALALVALVAIRGARLPLLAPGRWTGVLSLSLYMLGFSLAYRGLDAGMGALILFGTVQITMFAGAVLSA